MRLFFWCEEKFVPGYRCKNKKLYSLYIVEDDNDMEEKDKWDSNFNYETITPHISINTLEGINGFHTFRVIRKVDKYSLFIMIESTRTYNFTNSKVAN